MTPTATAARPRGVHGSGSQSLPCGLRCASQARKVAGVLPTSAATPRRPRLSTARRVGPSAGDEPGIEPGACGCPARLNPVRSPSPSPHRQSFGASRRSSSESRPALRLAWLTLRCTTPRMKAAQSGRRCVPLDRGRRGPVPATGRSVPGSPAGGGRPGRGARGTRGWTGPCRRVGGRRRSGTSCSTPGTASAPLRLRVAAGRTAQRRPSRIW